MINFDVVIIGSGLAGLSTALKLADNKKIAIISKRALDDSSSQWAQGGIAAAIGDDDSPEEHAKDTLNAGAGLNDKAIVDILTQDGVDRLKKLIEAGAPFDRNLKGDIQLGREAAHKNRRIVHAGGDSTGIHIHNWLADAVYKKPSISVKPSTFAWELKVKNGHIGGVLVYQEPHGWIFLRSPFIVMATGGLGQLYQRTTNPLEATADGLAMAYRAGAEVADLEFVQFHPSGLFRQGILFSEAARGEGAYLLNGKGERFMETYAPSRMELAPRDIVARAEQSEIDAGRGVNGEECINLDLRHLGKERIMERLPQIRQLGIDFLGIDCITECLPIQPTAHYSMGGIPTDKDCHVISDESGTRMNGFFAAGECACVSVHGGNRLGTNSLLEAVVFGERAGKSVLKYAVGIDHGNVNEGQEKAKVLKKFEDIYQRDGSESYNDIRNAMKEIMMSHCGVFRDEEKLKVCIKTLKELQERFKKGKVTDKGKLFNTEIYEILELGNMLGMAVIIASGALERKESRGGHFRTDFPKRDDENFLHHSMIFDSPDGLVIKKKSVVITKHQPAERTY